VVIKFIAAATLMVTREEWRLILTYGTATGKYEENQ